MDKDKAISEKVILVRDKDLCVALSAKGHKSMGAFELPGEWAPLAFYALYDNSKAVLDDVKLYKQHKLTVEVSEYQDSIFQLEDHLFSTAHAYYEQLSKGDGRSKPDAN